MTRPEGSDRLATLRLRALELIRFEYESVIGLSALGLDRLNKTRDARYRLASIEHYQAMWLGGADAAASFSVMLGIMSPADAADISAAFTAAHPAVFGGHVPSYVDVHEDRDHGHRRRPGASMARPPVIPEPAMRVRDDIRLSGGGDGGLSNVDEHNLMATLRLRAMELVRAESERCVPLRRLGLDRLNRSRSPKYQLATIEQYHMMWSARVGAVSSFAVYVGVISPKDAWDLLIEFSEAHPELQEPEPPPHIRIDEKPGK